MTYKHTANSVFFLFQSSLKYCFRRGLKCSCNLKKIQPVMKFKPRLNFNSPTSNRPLSMFCIFVFNLVHAYLFYIDS